MDLMFAIILVGLPFAAASLAGAALILMIVYDMWTTMKGRHR